MPPSHPRMPPRYGCEADPSAVAQYEAQLFPRFQVRRRLEARW